MRIEWKKVTWYSKLVALILFILLPFIGFVLGMEYQQVLDTVAGLPPKTPHIQLQSPEKERATLPVSPSNARAND